MYPFARPPWRRNADGHAMWCVSAVVAAFAIPPSAAFAQQPVQAGIPAPAAVIAAYRPPSIAVVQPLNGGTVPHDRPVVVIRYAQGEPADPLDPRSFRITVDGRDRTAEFQVVAGEAWGPIIDPAVHQSDKGAAARAHQVTARICSSRGACATTESSVITLPLAEQTSSDSATRRQKLLDLLLSATRRLLLQ